MEVEQDRVVFSVMKHVEVISRYLEMTFKGGMIERA